MRINMLIMAKKLTVTALCGLAFLVSVPSASAAELAAAANKITAIELIPQSSGKVVLQFQLQNAAVIPAAFSVNNPPKISLDFVGAANGLGKTALNFNDGGVRTVSVIETTGRTRAVISLEKMVGYETKVEGNKLLLTLAPVVSESNGVAATPSFAVPAPSVQAKVESIRDIDFRRGKNGEGRLVIDLTSANSGIDIRPQGKNLVVDIFKTTLPHSLERRMDVSDFSTPVQKVDSYSQGENVRLVIEPKGQWEHSAYQTDNRLIIEVRSTAEDKAKVDVNKTVYKGEKLSLNFQNVEVRTVLQVIAEFTGKNIITSDTVNGGLTLRLKDVPWDQALDLILQSRGLDKRENGNVIWIAPRDELAAKEKLQLESQQQIVELEQTRTEIFQMKYQRATDMAALLSNKSQSILSKRGNVVSDQKTNTLLVNDVSSKLEEVRALLAKLDVATRQVLIEARIVEAGDTFGKSLGARLFYAEGGGKVRNSGSLSDLADIYNTGKTTTPDNLAVNLPAATIDGALGAPSSFAALIGNSVTSGLLGLEISALESDGKGKVVSSPRIMTADQVEATIEYGEEIPFQKVENGTLSVEFKKAVLKLLVTPQITPDDQIIMKIKVNKDSRGQITPAGFAIDTKQVETLARVENGGTVVIGGIYQEVDQKDVTKVPFLGDIPYLGVLFKTTKTTAQKRELLVFITPKIVKDDLSLR